MTSQTCSTCGQIGHRAPACTSPNPTTHSCSLQHAHRCRYCGRTAVCCKPECIDLVDAYCAGYCGGNMRLRAFAKIARNESSALA